MEFALRQGESICDFAPHLSRLIKNNSPSPRMSRLDCQGLQMRQFAGKTLSVSAPKDELLQAVELALAGERDAAHELVQQYEDDATATWIHAVLHKIEGDLGNSRYWYRRADRMEHVADEPCAELAAIRTELATD
jgi:hypothetical protein